MCSHPKLDQIEWYMRRGRVPLRYFGLNKGQTHHHRHNHLDNPDHAAQLAAHQVRRLAAASAEVSHLLSQEDRTTRSTTV